MSGFYVDVDEMLSMINKVVFEELARAPLPDVREVKHAQWIKIHPNNDWYAEYMCSNCQNVETHERNYCPECGAKMDGRLNDEAETQNANTEDHQAAMG